MAPVVRQGHRRHIIDDCCGTCGSHAGGEHQGSKAVRNWRSQCNSGGGHAGIAQGGDRNSHCVNSDKVYGNTDKCEPNADDHLCSWWLWLHWRGHHIGWGYEKHPSVLAARIAVTGREKCYLLKLHGDQFHDEFHFDDSEGLPWPNPASNELHITPAAEGT